LIPSCVSCRHAISRGIGPPVSFLFPNQNPFVFALLLSFCFSPSKTTFFYARRRVARSPRFGLRGKLGRLPPTFVSSSPDAEVSIASDCLLSFWRVVALLHNDFCFDHFLPGVHLRIDPLVFSPPPRFFDFNESGLCPLTPPPLGCLPCLKQV